MDHKNHFKNYRITKAMNRIGLNFKIISKLYKINQMIKSNYNRFNITIKKFKNFQAT